VSLALTGTSYVQAMRGFSRDLTFPDIWLENNIHLYFEDLLDVGSGRKLAFEGFGTTYVGMLNLMRNWNANRRSEVTEL
jgi:hypothetical protein